MSAAISLRMSKQLLFYKYQGGTTVSEAQSKPASHVPKTNPCLSDLLRRSGSQVNVLHTARGPLFPQCERFLLSKMWLITIRKMPITKSQRITVQRSNNSWLFSTTPHRQFAKHNRDSNHPWTANNI